MLDRAWGEVFRFRPERLPLERGRRSSSRRVHRPGLESLESRLVMTASLAAIASVTPPSSQGIQVPLDGSGTTDAQTFTVTSSNPDILATVASGPFWTINVSHTSSGQAGDISFSGPITYQLFNDLTPTTVGKWETFVNDGYFANKDITRIVSNFSGNGDFVIQGGAPNPDGTGSSGQPGTPYPVELVQQLAFTNAGSLAVANTGQTNSNDTQFFLTTGTPTALNYGYTIFGQVVAGQTTISDLTKVVTQNNASGEKSSPVSPVTITSSSLSTTNPNGVVHIDTTGAVPGETANVTVTATDPTDNTHVSQTFQVTVGATVTAPAQGANGNANVNITFKPLAYPVSQDVTVSQPATIQLKAATQNPNNTKVVLSYTQVTQPTHGTISNFNATAGTLTYTPTAGYTGPDSFKYSVTNTGGTPSPLAGNTQTVSLTVTAQTAAPVAEPVTQSVTGNTPTNVQLVGNSENPTNPSVVVNYALATQPSHGTITNFNATTGTLTYTPNTGFTGTDTFTYSVTNIGGNPSPLPGNSATVTLNVGTAPPTPVNTGTVRVVGTVLVVTPLPRTDGGTNNIIVNETNNTSSPANDQLVVAVNGQIDTDQPLASSINRIVVYGAKASDNISINPAVDPTIAVTLDGGHGHGKNVLAAGAGPTREHGWFGQNTLIGGTGQNQLVGRAGHVTFKPTATTTEIFAGVPRPGFREHRGWYRSSNTHYTAPGGTFFKFVNGKLVPIPTPAVGQPATPTAKK